MSDSYNFQGKMNFTNSAVAFGQNATASTINSAGSVPPEEAALRADLGQLLSRLLAKSDELTAPAQEVVAGAVDEVAQELAEPKPRWQKIQTALGRVAPAVAALAELVADVTRIADAISPLIPH